MTATNEQPSHCAQCGDPISNSQPLTTLCLRCDAGAHGMGLGLQPAPPSSERLAEIRARVDAATAGAWEAVHRHCFMTADDDESAGLGLEIDGPPEASNRGQFARGADATFIAHARTDVPWLLSEVERLTAERDQARAALAEIVACTTSESGENRHMIVSGKGRDFNVAIRKTVALLAATPAPAQGEEAGA